MANLAHCANGTRPIQLLSREWRVHNDAVAGVSEHWDDPWRDAGQWFTPAVHQLWRLAPHFISRFDRLGAKHPHAPVVGKPHPCGVA